MFAPNKEKEDDGLMRAARTRTIIQPHPLRSHLDHPRHQHQLHDDIIFAIHSRFTAVTTKSDQAKARRTHKKNTIQTQKKRRESRQDDNDDGDGDDDTSLI